MALGDTLLQPENFGKYFHSLFENNFDAKRRHGISWKKSKNSKKSKNKSSQKSKVIYKSLDGTILDTIASCAPDVELPTNASQFAVYFAVRGAILERWMRQAAAVFVSSSSAAPNSDLPIDLDSDTEDITQSRDCTPAKVPKIVGLGLCSVFELIRESRSTHPLLCTKALHALLDVIQGQQPESLKTEPLDVMDSLFELLLDLATSHGPGPSVSDDGSHLTAIACACLLGLVVVRGDTGKLLLALSALLMCPRALANQSIKMPAVLVNLQRSVHTILLGKPTRPDFLTHGIPANSMTDSFSVCLNYGGKVQESMSVKALASDGKYIYMLTTKGLVKIGTGYGGSLKGHMYRFNKDINYKAWIGYCNNTLYYKQIGLSSLCEINRDTLQLIGSSDQYSSAKDSRNSSVMFSDGENLGMITAAKDDSFIVRTLNSSTPLDLPLKLARKCLEVIGGGSNEGDGFNSANPGVQARTILNLPGDEDIAQVAAGKDFTLVRGNNGKVYFSGKASVLGMKPPARGSSSRLHELIIPKNPRIIWIAVGHDGLHAILIADDGSAYFTGTARRGEDGDQIKVRRQPRASKPKKMTKVESHHIVQAACNNGTTALLTRTGSLLMFGKDTVHCDQTTGLVKVLRDEFIISVGLGKAHAVALTATGSIFTFGINNKGQCGREYSPPQKEAAGSSFNPAPTAMETSTQNVEEDMETEGSVQELNIPQSASPELADANVRHFAVNVGTSSSNNLAVPNVCNMGDHSFRHDMCMVCTACNECTGYSTSCLSSRPERKPGTECGCGVGDSGCKKCGICRVCALENPSSMDLDLLALNGLSDDSEQPIVPRRKNISATKSFEDGKHLNKKSQPSPRNMIRFKRNMKWPVEEQNAGSDVDRDATRVSLLPPARLKLPEKSDSTVTQVSCGLHHTVLLTENGNVYTFGSNQFGQLGVGDLQPRSGPQRVKISVPIVQVAAGSNHTILLSVKGEVYCFGNYQKGQLGVNIDQLNTANALNKSGKNAFVHCSPIMASNLGPQKARRATWISASGDQTFVKIDESLINATSLVNSIVVANKNSIILFPKYSTNTFKCLVINKRDGSCISNFPFTQADLSNQVICLDPIFGVLWTYTQNGKINCYNIISSEAKTNTDCAKDPMIEENKENYPEITNMRNSLHDVSETKTTKIVIEGSGFRNRGLKSIFNSELSLPIVSNCFVSRSQAAINILCCLDTLNLAQDQKLTVKEELAPVAQGPGVAAKVLSADDYQTVNRFDSHGGGWGYSGHAIEAIRFMCDTDVIIGGFGLFGGRGEYTGKIRLLDLGIEGGEQEGDGELLAETEEAPYDCAPRLKYPALFEEPVHIQANRWYVAWARVSGPSSDCGASGQHLVITEDQIQFSFKSSKKSNNGTDVNAGQIPLIYYKVISNEVHVPPRQNNMLGSEPTVHILSKDFSRNVTKDVFQALISLLQWSWSTFKIGLLDIFSQTNIQNQLIVIQELEKLVYISKASLRLLRTYINDIYPSQVSKKVAQESLSLAECIGDVRALLMQILSDGLPDLSKKSTGKAKTKSPGYQYNKKFYNMADTILEECHKTFVSCYHAFYPTANLKWQCLCDLLVEMDKEHQNCHSTARLLSAVLAALCSPSVRLRSTLPVLSAKGLGEPCHKSKLSPSDNAGLPMVSGIDGHHYPILVEQMSYRSHLEKNDFVGWQFKDVLDRLLDIVTSPVKQSINGLVKQRKTSFENTCNNSVLIENKQPKVKPIIPVHCTPDSVIAQQITSLQKRRNYIENIGMSNNSNETNNSNCNDVSPPPPPKTLHLEDRLKTESSHQTNMYSPSKSFNHESIVQVTGLVMNCCHLLARVVAELAYQCTGSDEDLLNACGRTLHCTPSRFSRSNQARTWNTGNGSPDAICFCVDRPGLSIVGAVIYGGSGCYDYELEILDYESESPTISSNKTHVAHRWNSLQMVEGTIGPEDYSKKDMAEIHFEKAIPVKENKKYAIRLRNHGGRTNNGDGGQSSVQGPCGATFHFSTCSLSFNGTTQTRGQIPSLLYYSNPLDSENLQTSRAVLEQQARKSTMDMVTTIAHCCRFLLVQARDQIGSIDSSGDSSPPDVDVMDLCKSLGESSIVNTLMPLVFAHVVPLLSDARSSVQVLTLIQELLPHVSALNQVCSDTNSKFSDPQPQPSSTPNTHYAWVESDHPYKQASVTTYRVVFPASVKWMTLEFDLKCGTVQPEDNLELFIPRSLDKEGKSGGGVGKSKFSDDDVSVSVTEGGLQDRNSSAYWPVLHKMSNIPSQWPTSGVILPGREVIFSMETASNYLKDERTNNYGFKCLVVGYEMPHSTNGLQLLENELAHLGGMCAASLIRRDLVLPSVLEDESDLENSEEVSLIARLLHGNLLSRGLALSQTPTIQQALDGTLPLSGHLHGRQFLRDFVSCAPGSSGGRLASWLQPESRLCPGRCEIVQPGPNDDALHQGWPARLTVVTRDQYGEIVQVPELKIQMSAVPVDPTCSTSSSGSSSDPTRKLRRVSQSTDRQTYGGQPVPSLSTPYEPTTRDKMCFKSITIMKAYNNYSFEELRLASPALRRSSESLQVQARGDGIYIAHWTPGGVGCYALNVTIDGYAIEEPTLVSVQSPPCGVAPPSQQRSCSLAPPAAPPARLRRFVARPSAGLRVRAHPSLQSEQLGIVMVDGTIAFIDEIHNDDGVWLRLSMDTIRELCGPGVHEAWCLQYNQHLGRTLLLPVEQPKSVIDIRETIDRKTPEIATQKISRKPLHRYFITKNRGIFHPQRVMRAPSSTASSDMTVHEGEEVLIREYVVNEEGAWGRLGCIFGKHLALDKESAWIVSHAKVVLDDNGLVHATTRSKTNPETGNGGKRAYDFSQSTGESSGNKFKFSPAPIAAANVKVKSNTPEVQEQTNPFIFGDQVKNQETSAHRTIKKEKVIVPKQDNQKNKRETKASGSKICESASSNTSNASPANSLSGSASSQKSVASSNSSICSVANMGSAINSVVGSSGHKFQALQKWFKGEETKDKSSDSKGDKKKSDSDRVESSGISVRDLVRAIGDSRSNGNAATPPDTPKREQSPRAQSSSPVTIPASRAIDKEQGSSPHGTSSPRSIAISPLVSGAALERRGSTLSDTSALVSSLTRDLSQSPSQSVTTPANVRDLSPAPSPSPTNSGNTKSEDNLDSPRKLAQAGTQTSPDNTDASANTAIRSHFSLGSSCVEEGDGPMSPKLSRRDHNNRTPQLPKSRVKRSISPGLCGSSQLNSQSGSNAQNASKQNILDIPLEIKQPIKEALAPSVAESLRAMFAAFLWHEGIVHDAMACASFLKFHPSLPKEGALVVTRSPHNVTADGHIVNHRAAELTKEERARQRHSVEVTTAGNYLQIQPSTLETLTRSAANANANRNRQRKSNTDVIKEEVIEGSSHKLSSLPEVVSILPPALKSLVLLWEQLSKACLLEFKENDSPSFCRPSMSSPSCSKAKPPPKEMSKEAKDKGNRANERAKLGKEMKTVSKAPKMRRFAYKKNSQNGSGNELLSPQESRKAREWPPFRCELCPPGGPPNSGEPVVGPVTHHMRREHPGCGGHADGRGYNSAGFYCQGWAGNCGEGGQDGSSWYLLCDQCREKYLTAAASDVLYPYYARANARAAVANNRTNKKYLGKHVMSPATYSGLELHEVIKHNAMFLLDLASAANTGMSNNQRRLSQPSLPSVSEKTTPPDQSGPWAPLPPFQCLASLGEGQEHQDSSFYEEEIKRQNLADNNGQRPLSDAIPSDNEQSDCSQNLRFHRSISMGQGGGGGPEAASFCQAGNQAMDGRVILMRKRNYSGSGGDANNDAGSSLLCYPSPNLQKLVPDNSAIVSEPDETSNDECLLNRPTMTFLFQNHDLSLLKLAMKQAIRKATCRIYALQAMNWLLRSVTQASCLHDLLWWFVYSLNPSNPEQDALDDACENRLDDLESRLCEHPVSDLIFSGDLCSPLASSLHAFLQSVADLTLALPSGSPLQMMAVRCWGIQFMQSDHAFLHRSHVFGNISKILSRSEEEACDDVVNSLCESNLSTNPNHQVLVESLHDITSSTEIKASSRQAMTGSLVDSSTETFWESGEEDRGKSKHIDVTCPLGTVPSVVYVHVDNSRDIGNKVSTMSFYNGISFSELTLIKTVDVESRSGTWLVCFLPEKAYSHVRVEVAGPDNSLRIRQIRVLGASHGKARKLHKQNSAASIQHRNCEAETLKVFRLITSQVFGKLILGESVPENINCSGDRELDVESSTGDSGSLDLREHMVGILFSRSKLTHLQKQVIVHIVQAIRKEAIHARVEWETFLCTPTTEGAALQQQHSSTESLTKSPDTYCFEMLSMVLALSGSSVGRAYLSHQYGLLRDLFSLLHTGSARVQRQVTSLLRRILPDVAPSALCTVISVPRLPVQDYNIITTGKDKPFDMHAAGILDVFLGCISKALTLQVKSPQSRGAHMVATMFSYIRGGPPDSARWWLAGSMAHKQAEGIIRLLKDMTQGKLSEAWAQVTKGAVAEAILNLTRLDDSFRAPQKCLQTPTLWLALAALCILDSDHVERLSSGQWVTSEGPVGAPPRPTCSNHDDGETSAVIQCVNCGNLCADCDRILHLPRRTRMHLRTVCKEEEEAIKVDVHEGCGRTKLFWLLALTDSATLKALVEFREGRNPRGATCTNTGVCRFCGTTGDTGLLAIGNVCADVECQEYGRTACSKLHPCGHICGGISGEKNCLPCLHGCGQLQIGGSKNDHNDHTYSKPPPVPTTPRDAFKNPWEDAPSSSQTQANASAPRLTQDSDDMCMICFTEALSCAPAIQLSCGHVFHAHCCRNVLSKRWPGPRITFGFSLCPICKCDMDHSFLSDLIKPIRELYADVKRKALMRLEYEGLLDSDALVNPGLRYHGNPTAFAMDRYAYYVCYKCNKAYYGGEARCDAEVGENYDPQELVCGGCSDVARAQMCPKHGADFLEYKCRYCCSVAVFFCFGTTHFCNPCHEDFQRVTNIPRLELPLCPAGPKALQLDGDECPLHIKHPPTGEEFALGCGVCRNAHTF